MTLRMRHTERVKWHTDCILVCVLGPVVSLPLFADGFFIASAFTH